METNVRAPETKETGYVVARSWWYNHKNTPLSEELRMHPALKHVHHVNAKPTKNKNIPRMLICLVTDGTRTNL